MIHAHAKVNLSLRVRPVGRDGFHPIRSLAQSVDWADQLHLEPADEDAFSIDGPLEPDESNLAWRAVEAVRSRVGVRRPVALRLVKQIPVAAGLGGGSADAAAALVLAADLFGLPGESLLELAPVLGSDVPFCLTGGIAWMEGRGEVLEAIPTVTGYALGIAVPPFELSAAAVYRRWDEEDGPEGDPLPQGAVPPALRDVGPIVNDLLPAARSLRPELGDWMQDLAAAWGRPVALTGSGPAVFGFFTDLEEAASAVDEVSGARAARAVEPVERGLERHPAPRG